MGRRLVTPGTAGTAVGTSGAFPCTAELDHRYNDMPFYSSGIHRALAILPVGPKPTGPRALSFKLLSGR
jgi:hypothetical protein